MTSTAKYQLQHGKHFGRDAEGKEVLYVPGDVLELTEDQAKAFADKFKLYAEVQAAEKVAAEAEKLKTAEEAAAKAKAKSQAALKAGDSKEPANGKKTV